MVNAVVESEQLMPHARELADQVAGELRRLARFLPNTKILMLCGGQPFGGEGLSGTGPKAGGPLYLYRLLANRPESALAVTVRHSFQAGNADRTVPY